MTHINLAQSDAEIERCFPTMQLLRPHLVASEFVTRIRRQQQQGFHLAYLEDGGSIKVGLNPVKPNYAKFFRCWVSFLNPTYPVKKAINRAAMAII